MGEAAEQVLRADLGLAAFMNHVVVEKFGAHTLSCGAMGQAFRETRPEAQAGDQRQIAVELVQAGVQRLQSGLAGISNQASDPTRW